MSQAVFDIKNLRCAYREDQLVLKIDELKIPRGELIFVLGLSGIGKSTFIETLGLMNNTVRYNTEGKIIFYPGDDSKEYEVSRLWQADDEEISRFRNDYFSFIFQDTNLMPNFTAGENMCISQLIKGVDISEAKVEVLKVMEDLALPAESFDKKITELSGGQRQRLAFVRAITSEFVVLFGDEPTGNLDKETAFKLMRNLKQNLKSNNRTGLIVSHDLELAAEFADIIYLLTPRYDQDRVYGEIADKNILSKSESGWLNSDGLAVPNMADHLYKQLNVNESVTL